MFLGFAFASALALSPVPAFAQHGGGGGGGGHAGGGGGGHFGGGGGHAGGGGGGRASGGSATGTAAGSRGGSSSGGASSGATSGGRASTGNYSAGSGTFVSGGARSSTASRVSAARYVGGNSTWQAPPNAAGARISGTPARTFLSSADAAASGARVVRAPNEPRGMRGPLSASTAMRGTYAGSAVSGLPPHVGPFPPRRTQPIFFFGGGCFGGFSPGFCGGGFFGGGLFLGFGYGWGCDPFWGCPGGFNGGYNSVYNGGYYNGGSFGGEIYGESTDDSSVSQEFNPSLYANPPEGGASRNGKAESDADYAAIAPEMALYLKDGTVYALSDYWVADGKLHYVTNYGGENAIDLDQIDMQRTVDVNAKRGISVTLKPAPAVAPSAPKE